MNTYYNNLYKPRPSFDELTVIKRAKDMNALLYDLLVTRSPHGHEDKISVIIQKFLATNKIGCEVKKDERGNLIIRNDKDDGHQIETNKQALLNRDESSGFIREDRRAELSARLKQLNRILRKQKSFRFLFIRSICG